MSSETTTAVPAQPASLWHRSWRRAWFKRGIYELLGLVLLTRRGWSVLNCGCAGPDCHDFALPDDEERDRYGLNMYRRLGRDVGLDDLDVVEIGCGCGGGAAFLCREFAPRSYLATDATRTLIAVGRRRCRDQRLTFRRARAERLPVADAGCDVVLSVETTHTLPDKAAFLAEMDRVLRPDGKLLIADFFYSRDSSRNAVVRFRSAVADSPFVIVDEVDWTNDVVAALEAQSPRRLAAIERFPRWLQPAALSFAGTTRSPLYEQLRDGRASHRFFRLERRRG